MAVGGVAGGEAPDVVDVGGGFGVGRDAAVSLHGPGAGVVGG